MIPQRTQRKRRRGFKLPPNTICCTRGTPFGNDFKVGNWYKFYDGKPVAWISVPMKPIEEGFIQVRDNAHAVELFRECRKKFPFTAEQIAKLKSADFLACYCKPEEPCHVDVIIEILKAS